MIRVAFFDTKPNDRNFFAPHVDESEFDVVYHEFHLNEHTAALAEGVDAVCIFVGDHANRPVIETLARLGVKLIALRCAGFNNVDLAAAHELGVAVARVPAYSPHAVAEFALGLLLTLNRRIHRAYNRVREQNFALTGLVGSEIRGKTIGIVGTGRIGRVAAKIFRGLDARVVATDRYPDAEWAAGLGVEYVDLETLLSVSDAVSLHTPLAIDSYHLLNKLTISKMKRGATIINTSRGALIDTTALIDALKSGQIGGVALDVYEEEEGVFFEDLSDVVLQDDELARLLTFPNVLITSHQAFLTREALEAIAKTTLANLRTLANGEPIDAANRL